MPGDHVTRLEFDHAITRLSEAIKAQGESFAAAINKSDARIEELFRSRQWNWPLVLSVVALLGAGLGFGIKNLVEVAAMASAVDSNTIAVDEFRERVRGLESTSRAMQIEEETQHKWIADATNMQSQLIHLMMQIHHPETPPISYWPMTGIGKAAEIDGSR